jgi:hypothetical protein
MWTSLAMPPLMGRISRLACIAQFSTGRQHGKRDELRRDHGFEIASEIDQVRVSCG